MLNEFEVIGFDNQKKTALLKIDKSKKGDIDERIQKLLDKINKQKNYFTTSSCSGRIVLLRKGERKYQSEWLYVSHELADFEKAWKKLSSAKGNICLKMESMILHVCCRTLEDANKLLVNARNIYGYAGIISLNKLIVEIVGSDLLEVPVLIEDKLIIKEESFKMLIKEANQKMKKNWERLEKFRELI